MTGLCVVDIGGTVLEKLMEPSMDQLADGDGESASFTDALVSPDHGVHLVPAASRIEVCKCSTPLIERGTSSFCRVRHPILRDLLRIGLGSSRCSVRTLPWVCHQEGLTR